jgi:hypothetical protein
LIAGLLLAAALNLRFNALLFLPLLPVLALCPLGRFSTDKPPSPARVRRWQGLGIIAVILLTVGLQHYYRILATYGTLLPSSFLTADPRELAAFSNHMRNLGRITLGRCLLLLIMVFPFLLAFLLPWTWRPVRQAWRSRSWAAVLPLLFLSLMMLHLGLTPNYQLRFFSAYTPLLYLSLPLLLATQPLVFRVVLSSLAGFTLLMMVTTGFAKTQMLMPDVVDVVPAPVMYIKPLRPWYSAPKPPTRRRPVSLQIPPRNGNSGLA